MTIKGLGKLRPLQGYMLMLAGYVVNRGGIKENPTEKEVAESRQRGLSGLKKLTEQDHGDEVSEWHKYLVENHGYGYRYGPSYGKIVKLLEDKGYNLGEVGGRSEKV